MVKFDREKLGLLTAAHCLGSTRALDGRAEFEIVSPHRALRFEAMGGSAFEIVLAEDFSRKRLSFAGDDVALLPIGSSKDKTALSLANFAVRAWEPLLIIGSSPFLTRSYLAFDEIKRHSGEAGFVVSLDAYCMLLDRDTNGVMRHMCQTSGGQSGSPVLVLREGSFFVAGVQSNGDHTRPKECKTGAVPSINAATEVIWNK